MTQSSEKGGWNPNQYPSAWLDAVAALFMLNHYTHLSIGLAITVEMNLVLAIREDSFENGVYFLAEFGVVPSPYEESKHLFEELIADWEVIVPEGYRQYFYSVVRKKEFFIAATNVLNALQAPPSRTVH